MLWQALPTLKVIGGQEVGLGLALFKAGFGFVGAWYWLWPQPVDRGLDGAMRL